MSIYKVSGVDTDTRGMGLFQCRRPVEISTAGDKLGMRPDITSYGRQLRKRAGGVDSTVMRLGEDRPRPLLAGWNSQPHFVSASELLP